MQFNHITTIPFDPEVFSYINWGEMVPHTFTNWREETLSWKKTCYIHGSLAEFPTTNFKGPDLDKLLDKISANGYQNFTVGAVKHIILCSPKGNVVDHGMILRTDEDRVEAYTMPYYPKYLALKYGFDVDIEIPAPEDALFLYQLAGPTSLQIVENALHQDIHDLKYMHFTYGTIAGHKVRVVRMGMGGTLSYEIHGKPEDSEDVYHELLRIGKEYGLVKLGLNQYCCNHTENGFAQATLHFPGAIKDDPEFVQYVLDASENTYDASWMESFPLGSLSDDITRYYRNPLELGWRVDFGHDFVGKEALEAIRDAGPRKIVTLEWNPDDIMKVFESYFQKGEEPYDDMAFPQDFGIMGAGENHFLQCKVLYDGREVGVSMWRTYTLYYRSTISLGCIDADLAEEGRELTIVWGDVGHRQLNIRAKVARFPYLDLARNGSFDMESIPRYGK